MGLDTAELIMWAEQEFEIEIPDRDAEHILTVGEFTCYIQAKQQDVLGSSALVEEAIFQRVKEFLVTSFNVAPDKITRNSYFIKDLHLDN